MIAQDDSNYEQWDLFENAATHSYARLILKESRSRDIVNIDDRKSDRKIIMAE